MNALTSARAGLLVAALLTLPAPTTAQSFTATRYDIGGEGRFDYLKAEPTTGRVFVSRSTHVMVVDGATGRVLGDMQNLPGVHGIAFAPRHDHGFTTNAGDSTVMMFDMSTLTELKRTKIPAGGLDGIMYDDFSDRIILTNHSRPIGTATALDGDTGEIVGEAQLEDNAPEGAASDGKGRIFVNNENENTIQVLDVRTMSVLASWPLDPCEGPTGIAFDPATNRIFSGCSNTSVVVDAATGKVVARIANGNGVDALGWDAAQKLIYIPAGRDGNVTIVHQDDADTYRLVTTVSTMAGARTLSVDETRHVAYVFTPEFGPSATPPTGGGRASPGPILAAWLYKIQH